MTRTFPGRRLAAPALALSLVASLPRSAQAQTAQPATPAPATMGARSITLAECVAMAVRDNPDAQSGDSDVRSAEAERAQVRGYFGPRIHVDANLQQWDRPFNLAFNGANFPVRDAFTFAAGVTVTQQLSALFPIYDQYKVKELGVDVAAIRRAATRKDVAFRTIEAFYRLLEAERLADVAEASIVQLEAQEKQAQSQFTNGVIGKNDLLRAGLALATARQRAIQIRGQVILAHGDLAVVMGKPASDNLEPAPFTGDLPKTDEAAIDTAEAHAVSQRLEVRELQRGIQQAQSEVGFAKAKLYPIINAVGNYSYVEGSEFQQTNSAYIGATLSWDVWDWGTTIGGIHAADAKVEQAIIARRKIEDQVRLEARKAFVTAQSAREALNVARTAVAQAEENFRIVTKKFEANAATSFDVVDAESLLTQARGQVEQALYDYLIACASLQRATGALLPGEV